MPPSLTSVQQLARAYLGPAAARELARERKASHLNLTLATLRIQTGLSPDDLANRMNTSLETVRRIEESTVTDITADETLAYLHALDASGHAHLPTGSSQQDPKESALSSRQMHANSPTRP